ncbi:MAG: hypothetical protein Q8936_16805, partial [Bacillota bacterium]|nr:hypothetical protein [Bacillota bacterium]
MIINSLKPNRDSYGIDEINCFEKPVGIVLDSYDQKLSGVFYMFIKCCNTYQLEPPEYCSNINNFDTMILAETIINNNFNLHFQRVIPHDDFHGFIEDNIKKYNRVLVPINLKELYYAHEYKTIDWPHLLVIKGFDHDKKLYNILDYTQQNYDDAAYTPFVMEYDTLLRTYRSYCDTFNSKDITVISNIQNETPSSIPDIIEQCLSLFDSKLSSNPHFLFNTMELILETIESQEKDEIKKSMKQDKIGSFKFSVICRFMANEVKGKNVFFTELINNSR